jgi:hypothetical protein
MHQWWWVGGKGGGGGAFVDGLVIGTAITCKSHYFAMPSFYGGAAGTVGVWQSKHTSYVHPGSGPLLE